MKKKEVWGFKKTDFLTHNDKPKITIHELAATVVVDFISCDCNYVRMYEGHVSEYGHEIRRKFASKNKNNLNLPKR